MTSNPTRWQPVVFAALGYAYIAAVVAAIVLAAAVLMAHGQYRLVWIPGTLLFVILPALWIRIPAPEGRVVTRNEYPDLFRAIDRVRERLEAPAPDVVLLTEELNAFVLERPLFGIAGWPRRYLGVGLPLMRAFAPDEFEAILAHEFAHLSREHSWSTRWLVRVSATWHVLVLGLEYSRHWGGVVFRPFFRWYMPRLDAVTLGVSRQHEFESDRVAAQVVGNQVAARALLRTLVCDRYLNDVVWRAICRESAAHASPPADVLGRVLEHLQSPIPSAELEPAVRASLRDRTLETDSHPRVADRMRALGAPAGEQDVATWVELLAERDGPDAAEALLGRDGTRTLAEELGTSWQARIAESWEQLHTDARRWQEALAAPASAEQPLAEPDVLWARARWASQCEPPGAAIPHFRRVLEQAPGHHEALTQLGMLLLEDTGEEEQREGAQVLEASLTRQARLAINAAEALQEYYTRARRPEDVRRCRARELQLRDAALRGIPERARLTAADVLRPCRLAPAEQAVLQRALEDHPDVERAYLIEKQTRYLSDTPLVVVAVEIRSRWYRLSLGTREEQICNALLATVRLPGTGDLLVVPVEPRTLLRWRLRRLPGAEIHRRGEPPPSGSITPQWQRPGHFAFAVGRHGRLIALCSLALLIAGGAILSPPSEPRTPAEWEAMLPQLRAAVAADPTDARAQHRLASALAALERWDEAAPVLHEAVRLNPSDAYLHHVLGWNLMRQRRPEEALPLLERVVQISPDRPLVHQHLGWALASLRRFAEAEAAYREAVARSPDTATAWWELGGVLIELRRPEDAEQALREAVRLEPQNRWHHRGLALALMQGGRLADALAAYAEAVRVAPEDARLWSEIGQLAHLSGDHARAVEAFERVDELDPSFFVTREEVRAMWTASRAQSLHGR